MEQVNRYLADESGDEQQHQDAVVISTVAKEGLGHEGGQKGNVSVGLTHLHLPQLHLNSLDTDSTEKRLQTFNFKPKEIKKVKKGV